MKGNTYKKQITNSKSLAILEELHMSQTCHLLCLEISTAKDHMINYVNL